MNRSLLVPLFALCTLAGSCASDTPPGGYRKVSASQKEVVEAARFAIKAESKALQDKSSTALPPIELLKVVHAEEQVVAGMNYALELSVRQGGRERTAKAVVWWQAWRKAEPYQLTSWTWTDAGR